jgi:hypothetical protein
VCIGFKGYVFNVWKSIDVDVEGMFIDGFFWDRKNNSLNCEM